MIIMKEKINVSKWGNSTALRVPKSIADLLFIKPSDEITIEVDSSDNENKLIIKKVKSPSNIYELFQNYNETSFNSKLDEVTPVGNELW